MNVTPAEATLFHIIGYGTTLPPGDLPGYAANDYYSIAGLSTADECRAALDACLAKGWLQEITEATVTRITDSLAQDRVLGPIYRLPRVGGIDFTHTGAALWRRFLDRTRETTLTPFVYTAVVHRKTARFFRTREAAVAEIEQQRICDEVVSASGPHPTGPWRVQWWRRFPDGYRIDIEERAQWHCGGGGGESCIFWHSPPEVDLHRLREVLARHTVALAEWAVLESLEGGPRPVEGDRFHWWSAEETERKYGTVVSEENYRDAVEFCRSRRWVRTLNRQALKDVHVLLRNDPVLLAVPDTAELFHCTGYGIDPANPGTLVLLPIPTGNGWGEIDFTPAGADLYRAISAEWLGADWEDDLAVSKEYYREEHRYCEAEEGFAGIVEEYTAKGEVVRARRVVPIGPWCVHWWERFPSGVRLELQIEPRVGARES